MTLPKPKTEVTLRPASPASVGKYPGKRTGTRIDELRGIICEYDVPITSTDGITFYVDVFRPSAAGQHPPLIAWSPYGKHLAPWNRWENIPGTGVSGADLSEYTIFEAPDPVYWSAQGYAVINVDPRGTWGSEGDITFMSELEAKDCAELIEWAGTRDWSNGNVGMTGVSYLAWSQWRVAALNPPHLKAINPNEGVSDFYRETARHGGIPATFFSMLLDQRWSFGSGQVEDLKAMLAAHPFFDDYWASKNADLSNIKVPAYVVAGWGDQGLHTRGTLEGFKKIGSSQKWLKVHGRKKWQNYYEEQERQRQFFDKFLKGIPSEVDHWPPVKIEVRERYYEGNLRAENEWPLQRTEYVALHLDAATGSAGKTVPETASNARYRVDGAPLSSGTAHFDHTFTERTELTGHMKLKLWVEALGNDDMDLFVFIDKIDRSGDRVPFQAQTTREDGPVALGWLRVSHRELDERLSTVYQPVLKHAGESKLSPGQIVPVEIEIWPSSTLFEAGEKLRITLSGRDVNDNPSYRHLDTVNTGTHVVHTGGTYDSHLLVPVIPT